MQHSIPTGRTSFRLVIVVCLLFAGMANSGCVTTLGYLPDDIKPQDLTRPTYKEVVQWGTDLKDGYGSRASGNRNAIYGGALVAAAAVGAVTGLAAFNTGSSAILGIGLGTGFLSSVAAIYSNDLRAQLYDRASSYMDRLLIRSQTRLSQRQDVSAWASQALLNANKAKAAADSEFTIADAALTAAQNGLKAAPDDVALKDTAAAALTSKNKAIAAQTLAQKRVDYAQRFFDLAQDSLVKEAQYNLAKRVDANAKAAKDAEQLYEQAQVSLKKLWDPETDEAQCLRGEIRVAIDKVTIHLEQLSPANLVAQLKQASQASKGTTLTFTNAATNFNDLETLDNDTCPILGL